MLKTVLVVLATVAAASTLSACSSGGNSSGGRFAGFNTCSADGSVVLYEYPNAEGSYDTLNTGPCKR
ncbi:MAG TPA: hypothetical protein VGG27_04375 [Magnetospirillaceae bacterium]|jgi:hypothetical protein